MTAKHRIFTTHVAKVYPYHVARVERKARTKAEVDEVICWLTGYTPRKLAAVLKKETDLRRFSGGAETESGADVDHGCDLRGAHRRDHGADDAVKELAMEKIFWG